MCNNRLQATCTVDPVLYALSCLQAQKVYVQDRLRESGDLVWKLLQEGGHFYVCGDAAHMAGSVEQALLSIIRQHQVSICLHLALAVTLVRCKLALRSTATTSRFFQTTLLHESNWAMLWQRGC